ncbi:MAG: sigma-54 dependent transcriptional regulator [Deltaproteobacteria bacterium]|nr:sigma-54 dependent transcriptional regulator [Deltaproteobacteria bacterium]
MEATERVTRAVVERLLGAWEEEPGGPAPARVAENRPEPRGRAAAGLDVRQSLAQLARAAVEAVLALAGQEISVAEAGRVMERAARKQLMTLPDLQEAHLARLCAQAPRLVDLPRLVALAREGLAPGPAALVGRGEDPEPVGGRAPAFRRVLEDLALVAETEFPVLLVGETGTGKEVLARRLHRLSPRRGGPFVAVNCAALPEGLLESELFGHEKGAFTGAMAAREGYLRAARGGTLFLDELGETGSLLQTKLLRVLEEHRVTPVGASRAERVDFRLVCASHRDLSAEAAAGRFNPALLYRVQVVPLRLPPLRERPEDLPELVDHFLAQACGLARREKTLAPELRRALLSYSWPGNVRQLSHVLQHMVALGRGSVLGLASLPPELAADLVAAGPGQARGPEEYQAALAALEPKLASRAGELAKLLAARRGQDLANRHVRSCLGCSDTTAKNLLGALARAGLVRAVGQTRGRRYLVEDREED